MDILKNSNQVIEDVLEQLILTKKQQGVFERLKEEERRTRESQRNSY